VENADDRREFARARTRKGEALYEELIPRLKRREQEILACLSAQERMEFAAALGKIEKHLGLVQVSRARSEAEAY
jgi:DNA-binding MarR family transcriptional regulator